MTIQQYHGISGSDDGLELWGVDKLSESEFSRKTEPIGCVHIEKEMYYMELAHIIMEAGKSKICQVDQQAGDPGEVMFQLEDVCCRTRSDLLCR